MARYLRLFAVQMRASLLVSVQYRTEIFVGGAMALFWLFWNLVPMVVVWKQRPTVAGWTFPEALLVVAWFTLLRSLLEGAVQPSLVAVVEHIRKGTLDFILLKPADAQFLVSTARFEPAQLLGALSAFGIALYAFYQLGRVPAASDVLVAIALTLASAALLYALAILVVSAAFWVVRLDNLIYLFNSVFDAGRWPSTVFRGAWRLLFTFVIPVALMTTYPAMALLGRLRTASALEALGGALVFALCARWVWTRALGHYTSASS
jgi:ABC-2 type transport system permease protein